MNPKCTHSEERVCPPNQAYDVKRHCALCRLYDVDDAYNVAWGGCGVRPEPCRFKGDEKRRIVCETCLCPDGKPGRTRLKVFACEVHGECTPTRTEGVKGCCAACPEYEPKGPHYEVVDASRLMPGHNFNGSIVVHQGRRLLAYRQNWSNARLLIAELDSAWQPVRNRHLDWSLPGRPRGGQEDPKLFVFAGRLHLSCTWYDGRITSVAVLRLRDDLTVEKAWIPELAGRNYWEKNWSPFEWGELYAVYFPAPHKILRLSGDKAELVHETPNPMPWRWGEMRGGCPPVRRGDEFYHFFHSREDLDWGVYSVGVYCFETRPPFRITRFRPRPLLTARLQDRPHDQSPAVVFPGGAVLENGVWRVCVGWMDSGMRYLKFDREQIEKELISV